MCYLVSFRVGLNFFASIKFLYPYWGIKVLGVPLGSLSFTSFFLQEALDNDVQHMDALPKLEDV